MSKKSGDFDLLLYELAVLLEYEKDLRHTYFAALIIFMLAFNLDKIIIFKYSRSKKCFDPKVGLKKEYISEIKDIWEKNKSETGYFARWLLDMSCEKFNHTECNEKIQSLNLPCNEASRSIASTFITDEVKKINIQDIKNRRIQNILKEIEMTSAFYIPLLSRGKLTGFILCSGDSLEKERFEPFKSLLGIVIDNFINIKERDNIKTYLDKESSPYVNNQEQIYKLGKATATVAHEMKNALVGIIGLFNKLKKHIDKNEKAQRYTSVIEDELNKLYNFTLDINKYSKDLSVVQKTRVNLQELINKSIDMVEGINSNIVFSVYVDEKAKEAYVDKSHMERVFINLFKNSMEAYGDKKDGKITVVIVKSGNNIVIKIRDDAGGIKKDNFNNILKPFFTTKKQGTGLGLSIVRDIIKKHNGTVEFKNIDSKGLECTIRLPA